MVEAVKVADPDEVYNMAASSFVSTAFEQPVGNCRDYRFGSNQKF